MPEWNVPGYTELRPLGSGGFGDVVLARHNRSGVLVAIKYLRHDLLTDQAFAEMFRDEAAVLATMDDPNIVRLYEYVESPMGAAIVMELIEGVSLREILTQHGQTTAEAALAVLQGSLMGLAAAHQRGVVHRDYKPENVLVAGDGMSKLTDFGLAARAGDLPLPAGTYLYGAPEQIAGASASPAGDVYAATATFYECLTGRPPFSGDSAELLRQHSFEPVPLDPVPEPLRPLVEAGMAKDPGRRPADAMAFVTELQAVASTGYGGDWENRGRSHLGEAALLLAALWPSGAPPAAQEAATHQVPLRQRSTLRHGSKLRHFSPVQAAVVGGIAVAVVAAGAALAASNLPGSHTPSSPAAQVHPVTLAPSTPATGPGSLAPTPATSPTTSEPSSSPSPGTGPTAGTSPSSSSPTSQPPPPPPPSPTATVCQPDGTGCTKGGTYPDPNALISSNYTGFQVTWSSTSVQPYSSGVPLYWTVGMTYTNVSSTTLTLTCAEGWENSSYVQEQITGGLGDDTTVPAETTTCSENPDWTSRVAPGDTVTVYATFHNVPWPGNAVAITWGNAGTSAAINPFT